MRASGHSQKRYLSRYIGAIVASGTLTATPDPTTGYPVTALAVNITSGSHTAVYPGFLVNLFTAAGLPKGSVRVRYSGTISSVSIPIVETSRATVVFASGDLFEIRAEVRPASKVPTADSDFNPDGKAFSANFPPIACSGGHWAGFADVGLTYATVVMTGSTSTPLNLANVSGVTHLWVLPTGVAFAPGSSSTDASPTLRADVNADGWAIRHEVTDADNSTTTIQFVVIIVHDRITAPPYQCITHPISVDSAGDGWAYTVELFDDLDATSFPVGSLCILWVDNILGGVETTIGAINAGRHHIRGIGYARRSHSVSEGGYETYTLDVISPIGRQGELVGFSKVFLRDASPTAWGNIPGMTVKRVIWALWLFYSNFCEAGYDLLVDSHYLDYDFPTLFSQKETPRAQIMEFARATQARMVCAKHGAFLLQPIVNLLDTATKAALPTFLQFERADILRITVDYDHFEAVDEVVVEGFSAHATDPTPLRVRYPGDAPGMGSTRQEIKGLITQNIEGLKAIAGRIGARANSTHTNPSTLAKRFAPYVEIDVPLSYDAVADFRVGWFELPFATRKDGLDLSQYRYEIDQISINYDGGDGSLTLGLQSECDGQPGVDYPFGQSNTSQLTDPSDIWQGVGFDPYTGADLLGTTANIALLRGDSVSGISGLVYTSTFTSTVVWGAENWQNGTGSPALLDAAEYIVDGVQKPGTARTLFTATNTKARIFTNILNGTTLGLTYALRATSALRIVQAERSDPNVCYILTSYSDGIWSEGHINGVAITANLIGDGTYTSSFRPALFVDPNNSLIAYTITRNGSGKIRLFKTTNGGVSWTENADYQWNTVATSSGCSKPADNVTHGIFISRSFSDPSVMYIGGKDAANSWPIYRCTSSTNVIISFLDSGTCASFTGWAGPTNRRGFRTFDADRNLLVSQFFLQSTASWALYKSVDRGDNWIPIRSTGVGSSEPSLYLGGDGAVYECLNNTIRFHPNIYTLTDDSQFTDKTGTGYPATIAPHVLFGL